MIIDTKEFFWHVIRFIGLFIVAILFIYFVLDQITDNDKFYISFFNSFISLFSGKVKPIPKQILDNKLFTDNIINGIKIKSVKPLTIHKIKFYGENGTELHTLTSINTLSTLQPKPTPMPSPTPLKPTLEAEYRIKFRDATNKIKNLEDIKKVDIYTCSSQEIDTCVAPCAKCLDDFDYTEITLQYEDKDVLRFEIQRLDFVHELIIDPSKFTFYNLYLNDTNAKIEDVFVQLKSYKSKNEIPFSFSDIREATNNGNKKKYIYFTSFYLTSEAEVKPQIETILKSNDINYTGTITVEKVEIKDELKEEENSIIFIIIGVIIGVIIVVVIVFVVLLLLRFFANKKSSENEKIIKSFERSSELEENVKRFIEEIKSS